MRYLNKVVFINSANVKYAEVAIDGNVHFIGTQGVGKSTLLRAILFFYNADKLKLGIEKGKKTFDEYYFPFGNSYLVFEVAKESGPFCVMAFKAQGRVCFRFINGAYNQDNYIGEDGKVRMWDGGIRESLGKKTGYSRKIDRYEEYRDILYGNNMGLDKEFRKYAIIESRQYQNIPRTIQNVFLNSKLDAEFIKQTIIMSLNEEDIKIELEKYALHLKDFDTQLSDINKWTEVNKSGEIPVRKMAENIARIHAAIQSLNREMQETAVHLFRAYEAAIKEQPLAERKCSQQAQQRQLLQDKSDDLKRKFQAKREEIQKQINILDNDLKKIKAKNEHYEGINILSIIQRVDKKDDKEAEKERLQAERTLLSAKFTEINSRYEALIQQQKHAFAEFSNSTQVRRNKLQEDFLQFKDETDEQYRHAFAEIRKQHQADAEISRNSISQKKDSIHDLKLKKQKIQMQRYYEQDMDAVRSEISMLQQKIKITEVEINDLKKQTETLQKQWELEQEKTAAYYDRKAEKMREDGKRWQDDMAAIDAKLQKNKNSLYGWLSANMPGWENNIGKVIDEDKVLFHEGLSPQWAEGINDNLFGLKIDLGEIDRAVKTVTDYEQEKQELQKNTDENRAGVNKLIEEKNSETDKLRSKYQGKIKENNNNRRQLEYELQRHKGQFQVNEVKQADLLRKANEEREQHLQQAAMEIGAASEDLIKEEKKLGELEAATQRQLDNKEKELAKKIKTESQRLKELYAALDQEVAARKLETDERVTEIKLQHTNSLQTEGADVIRLSSIEKELAHISRELNFINDNRDIVAVYRKDKQELLDHADAYKTEKRLRENQLENEQEKYNLQKQKLQQEIQAVSAAIDELNKQLAALKEGLGAFDSFKQTDYYKQVAQYEGRAAESGTATGNLKSLIDALNGKIYTIQERYNDLQTAINKFTGNFDPKNIFGFKTGILEREEFIEFAENLYEFLEEDKIVQFEKRVNERFATLIRQIGKETTELTSKGGEIQKVITEINRDFEERNFAGVIKSIKLQLSPSQNAIVNLLQEIKKFNDQNSMGLGVVNLFSSGDNEQQNKKAVALLKEFAREINARKEKEISLPDSFELQFRIVENENDSGWVEKLTNVGSEGTDILVKAMINIMLLNVFKDSASKRFKDFRLHCMMDEIGKLHPNNVKGILKFANDRNILLINSSPTSYNATDYRYTYLLSKDNNHVTTVKRLVKKGSEVYA